ncbi:hypothetical protein D9M68_976580 [compost metagenome]
MANVPMPISSTSENAQAMRALRIRPRAMTCNPMPRTRRGISSRPTTRTTSCQLSMASQNEYSRARTSRSTGCMKA